jgi:hypothetical protein
LYDAASYLPTDQALNIYLYITDFTGINYGGISRELITHDYILDEM